MAQLTVNQVWVPKSASGGHMLLTPHVHLLIEITKTLFRGAISLVSFLW
jgi:hypothetical protein